MQKMGQRVGVTGYKGRLGSYLISHFPNFVPLDCDVTRLDSVKDCLASVHPDTVLHLAAKSDVDWCEEIQNEKTLSNVNIRGTFHVCVAAEEKDMEVILLSSDHVFSGNWGKYKENSKPDPINQYGRSKLAAESWNRAFDNLKIIRTSYFFDRERLFSNIQQDYPTFISRSFIHIQHLSELLIYYFTYIGKTPKILHLSGSKICSWYELMDRATLGKVYPRRIEEKEFAARPKRGGLDISLSQKLGFPSYSYLDGMEFL